MYRALLCLLGTHYPTHSFEHIKSHSIQLMLPMGARHHCCALARPLLPPPWWRCHAMQARLHLVTADRSAIPAPCIDIDCTIAKAYDSMQMALCCQACHSMFGRRPRPLPEPPLQRSPLLHDGLNIVVLACQPMETVLQPATDGGRINSLAGVTKQSGRNIIATPPAACSSWPQPRAQVTRGGAITAGSSHKRPHTRAAARGAAHLTLLQLTAAASQKPYPQPVSLLDATKRILQKQPSATLAPYPAC